MTENADMTLRAATLDDATMLAEWRGRPHVAAGYGAEEPSDFEDELTDIADWHDPVIAEKNGAPIGYVDIIDPAREDTHYWGDVGPNLRAFDIFVADAANLGKGYGAKMIGLALARCFAPANVTAVIIDPLLENVRAQRFYERLGFKRVGVQKLDDNLCLVMRIERADWAARLNE